MAVAGPIALCSCLGRGADEARHARLSVVRTSAITSLTFIDCDGLIQSNQANEMPCYLLRSRKSVLRRMLCKQLR